MLESGKFAGNGRLRFRLDSRFSSKETNSGKRTLHGSDLDKKTFNMVRRYIPSKPVMIMDSHSYELLLAGRTVHYVSREYNIALEFNLNGMYFSKEQNRKRINKPRYPIDDCCNKECESSRFWGNHIPNKDDSSMLYSNKPEYNHKNVELFGRACFGFGDLFETD